MIKSLLGKTKRNILALFFLNSDKQYYLSEVIRATKTGQGGVQRELKSLVASGILNTEVRGRQTFYSVNKNNAIFEELYSIIFKTYAIEDILTKALTSLKDKITVAFIYGSIAKGTATVQSDIDLFVVGQAKFGDLSVAVSKPEAKLNRSVNIHSLTPKEFATKINKKNHFVNAVIKAEKIFLIGSENDIRRMEKKQVAERRTNQRQRNSRSVRHSQTKHK